MNNFNYVNKLKNDLLPSVSSKKSTANKLPKHKPPVTQTSKQHSSFDLFDINIWNTNMKQAVSWIIKKTETKNQTKVGFVNANNLNIAYADASLTKHYQSCDRVFGDGSGVMLASQILSNRKSDNHISLNNNINGTDMFPPLCDALEKSGGSIYLLGAEEGIAKKVSQHLKKTNPNLKVAGYHNGYLSDDLSCRRAIKSINQSNPSILLVAMGTPLQEFWLDKHANSLQVPVIMSVGGLFDFFAKKVSRAPKLLRNIGLEWTWRLAIEPQRMWKRYLLGNPLFMYRVWKELSFIKPPGKPRETFLGGLLRRVSKRLLDISLATLGLLILSPALVIIAACIVLESPGNPLYTQQRVGRNNKLFKFWKFRSMVKNAHSMKKKLNQKNNSSGGVLFKLHADPRVTKIGQFIRKTSIDELPQLWNVLIGDMSLVGPRPALPEEVARYSASDMLRLKVAPGITCYWQVSGRSDLSFNQQIILDKKYIKTRSLLTDLKILLKTFPAVISGKGAY